jgi:hypothetical protein
MNISSTFSHLEMRDLCFGMLERSAWTTVADSPNIREAGPRTEISLEKRRNRLTEWKDHADRKYIPVFQETDKLLTELIHNSRYKQPGKLLYAVVELCDKFRGLRSGTGKHKKKEARFQIQSAGRWTDNGTITLRFRAGRLLETRNISLTGSALNELSASQQFILAVGQMSNAYRQVDVQHLPPEDRLAVERAFQLVERGVMPPRIFHPILTTLERPYQTYLSLADPGEWHLETTATHNDLLAGTMVHIEYIDRGTIDDKGVMEAYRIPSIRNAARLRVVVGEVTPCTVYIGRPLFENRNFDLDLLKTAHTVAAACSAMFALGVADCKIAMDNLSCTQAITFMWGIAGNVIRDPHTQRLSGAFNLNTPLLDDRDQSHKPVRRTKKTEIARLAIELVAKGHFDKVAWDGAGRGESRAIIGQLSELELFELVHEAHRQGLETYISAGMDAKEMISAVRVGVGGVGIGTRLHERADGTMAIGRLDGDLVRKVLVNRDKEAKQVAGRAANCMARFDWLYAEASTRPELREVYDRLEDLASGLHLKLRGYLAITDMAERNHMEQELERVVTSGEQALGRLRQQGHQLVGGNASLLVAGRVTHQAKAHKQYLHPALEKAARIVATYQQKIGKEGALPIEIKELRQLVSRRDVTGVIAWLSI